MATVPGVEEAVQGLREDLALIAQDPDAARAKSEASRKGNPITLGPLVVPAEEWVEDMAAGAQAKADKWLKKTLRPSKDPKATALAAEGKYTAQMQEALAEGRWGAGIRAIDEAVRQQMIEATGAAGYRAGVTAKKPKALAKIKRLQPMVASLKERIAAMPQDTPEQREARMLAARRGMIEIGKAMRGG